MYFGEHKPSVYRSVFFKIWRIIAVQSCWCWLYNYQSATVCCSVTKSCLTLCDPMNYSTPGSSVLHCLWEFAQIIRIFFSESALCIRWPKYWSFSSSISPSNEYSGLISFRIDWFELAVQGTLKSLQPVHPKADQSWMFTGRTDVEAETSVLWPPDVKSWLIGKDPDAGRDWGQEEKGTTEDEMAGWHH